MDAFIFSNRRFVFKEHTLRFRSQGKCPTDLLPGKKILARRLSKNDLVDKYDLLALMNADTLI